MAYLRLFMLLALLVPLFVGLYNLVLEGVPRVEIRFVSQDVPVSVPVPVEVPVERVVERVVYVPVDRVETPAGAEAPQLSPDSASATSPADEATSEATPEASEATAAESDASAPTNASAPAAVAPAAGGVITAASAPSARVVAADADEPPDEGVDADSLATPPAEVPAPEVVAASVGTSLSAASGEIHQAAIGANRGPFVPAAPVYVQAPAEEEAAVATDEQPEGAVAEGGEDGITVLSAEDLAAAEAANEVATGDVAAVDGQPEGVADEAPVGSATNEQAEEDIAAEPADSGRPVFEEVAADLGQASVAAKLKPDVAAGPDEAAPAAVEDEATPGEDEAAASEDEAAASEDEAAAVEDEATASDDQAETAGAASAAKVGAALAAAPVADNRGDGAPAPFSNEAAMAAPADDADETPEADDQADPADDEAAAADDEAAPASDDVRADVADPAVATPVSNGEESLTVEPQS